MTPIKRFHAFDPNFKGVLCMVFTAFSFSVMNALVKHLSPSLPPTELAFARSLGSVMMLSPYMMQKKIPFLGKNKFLILRSLFGFLSLCCSFYALSTIPIADASILGYTSIAFIAALSAIVLGEAVTPLLVIYILISFIGAGLVTKPSLRVANVPGLIALLGGFLGACAHISIKKLRNTTSFLTIVFNFSFYSTLLSAALFYKEFKMPASGDFLFLVIIGIAGTLGQLFMTYAYMLAPASLVSPYLFSGVLFSFVWGILFWNEIPDAYSLVGTSIIIVCGIGIIRLREKPIPEGM